MSEEASPDFDEHDFIELGPRAALVMPLENAPQTWNARYCVISMALSAGGR